MAIGDGGGWWWWVTVVGDGGEVVGDNEVVDYSVDN